MEALSLAKEAFALGAKWVVLPEFFTTGITFDDVMLDGARPIEGEPTEMILEVAKECGGVLAGSFLAKSDGHVFNTMMVASPDGQTYSHDKDFPSGPIEHSYYIGAEDEEFVSILQDRGIQTANAPTKPRVGTNVDGLFQIDEVNVSVALC